MDRRDLPPGVRRRALEGLERISRWPFQRSSVLGGVLRLLGGARGRRGAPLRLVELGAGGGTLSRWLEAELGRRGFAARVVPTDLRAVPGVRRLDALRGRLPSADLYFSNLLLHHLADDGVRSLLGRLGRASALGWVHFDLHRHRLHFHAASALIALAGLPEVNRLDARTSIQQGYLRRELEELARPGGAPGARVAWRFPFRWELSWKRP